MTFQYLQYDIVDFVASLTIDRPPVNALNSELVGELRHAATAIEEDVSTSKVRSVVITSNGKYFCAGADLKERMGMREEDVAPTVKNIGAAMSKIAEITVPTIAALQGSAFGGGFEVALAADIRIVVESAQLGLRETALAIIPGAGATQRLTQLAGRSNAILWITSARLFTAEEALAQGVVNYVVRTEDLLPKAFALAGDIARNGPLAVRQAKRAIVGGLDKNIAEGLALEFECYKNIIPTADRLEGLTAFREKRVPKYDGK